MAQGYIIVWRTPASCGRHVCTQFNPSIVKVIPWYLRPDAPVIYTGAFLIWQFGRGPICNIFGVAMKGIHSTQLRCHISFLSFVPLTTRFSSSRGRLLDSRKRRLFCMHTQHATRCLFERRTLVGSSEAAVCGFCLSISLIGLKYVREFFLKNFWKSAILELPEARMTTGFKTDSLEREENNLC